MKFLLIANNDSDGVGQVARNLCTNLNFLGHNCKTLVLNKKFSDNNIIKIKRSFIKRALAYLLNYIKVDFDELFGFGISTINLKNIKEFINDADIIVIFTFYKVLSNSQLNDLLKTKKKIFLRPLDIEMASGGCHFNMECTKYRNNCDNCHKIIYPFRFIPKINLLQKKEIINTHKPNVLVQNYYVKKVFDKSSVFKNINKKVLYIGTNETRSKFISQHLARKKLRINKDEKVILFATFNLSSYIKGGHLLVKALEILDKDIFTKKNKVTLLTLGNKQSFHFNGKNINWRHLNTTRSNRELNEIFRASNLMVCPSLFCFGPHIVEEALINKLPVVSFDLGSSQDFIVNGKNGYLVRRYNVTKFATSIKKVLIKNKFKFNNELHKKIKNSCSSINEAQELIKITSK